MSLFPFYKTIKSKERHIEPQAFKILDELPSDSVMEEETEGAKNNAFKENKKQIKKIKGNQLIE